jgi:catechol 2,3-dioxygenase-like lactoylglutathione lyase family enzyme
MPLHRLNSVTIGVPKVSETISYYREFGLREISDGRLATTDGGEQLIVQHASSRRLVAMSVGVDDRDDLDRITVQLTRRQFEVARAGNTITTREPVGDVRVEVTVTPRNVQEEVPPTPYNGPGRLERANNRAPVLSRTSAVRPRKLGHVVIGSVDQEATQEFFTAGLGFKTSDVVPGLAAFMRCSTDHHNVLVQQAPLNFLHHTAWQVDDVDEVGRGAMAMLAEHPERHAWGLGRHHIGSNFFWYLRDPSGHFSEYYSDLDCIVDDQLWTPGVFEGAKALYDWGPPPPPSFLHPEDLAALMTGAHAAG